MKPHEEWIFKAEQDLESAQILITSVKPLYDVAVYHTQQAAEKALKSFLAYKEQKIEKIHHLVILVGLCQQLDEDFSILKDDAIFLNPYATLYRYPEGDPMPSIEETREAIEIAKKILDFVRIKEV